MHTTTSVHDDSLMGFLALEIEIPSCSCLSLLGQRATNSSIFFDKIRGKYRGCAQVARNPWGLAICWLEKKATETANATFPRTKAGCLNQCIFFL